jgi:hypothetical protein
MIDKQILKLYELRGRLEARVTILDSDILFTVRLRESLVSDTYNGYTRGKIEAYEEWQRDLESIRGMVNLIIKELEDVRE